MHKLLLKALLNTSKCEVKFLHGVDLEKFLDRGQIVDGVRYPTGYISEQGEAWGIYHQGALIGGYVVAVKGPFRTTTGLRAHGIKHYYRDEEMIELGGVWVEKEFRQKKYTTCLWLHMVSRIKDHNRPFVIYGYNLQRSGLQKLYAAGKPDVLFRGQSLGNSSVKTHSTASIEVVNVRKALSAMILKSIGRAFTIFLVKSRESRSLPAKDGAVETIEVNRGILSE